jgi:P2-related tail formation protein
MSNVLRGSRLIEVTPPSLSYDAQVQSASYAFDQEMYSIIDDTGQVVILPSILELTDPDLIDALAWQLHVDGYDSTKFPNFRKRLIQDSLNWHVRKGTVALIQEVIDLYWPGGATLQEWFEYMSPLPPNYPTAGWHNRYLFRILINADVIPPEDEVAVVELINRYKPISRWLDTILRSRPSHGICFAAGYAQFYTTRASAGAIIR